MCILFFCQSELCSSDGYKLILANNRDEAWNRPTQKANFWNNGHCISGLDLMQDRAGGTWLGMNKDGQIGALLNILGQQDHTKEGRGFLVSDFISGKKDIHNYAEEILDKKDNYNGFNLVLFDLSKQEDFLPAKPVFVSNTLNYFSCINYRSLPSNTFFGVSNSPLEFPLQKVVQGRQKFGQIVSKYPKVSTKDLLLENLLQLMSDKTQLLPDPVLEKAGTSVGYSPDRIGQQSAINVISPQARYGTRTSTIILVDGANNVDYVERTVDPENTDSTISTVIHQHFSLLPCE
ncbi:transport and Golgi organization 2 homolog [Biomphalaria glabrata]|uniref:Transport and Golgi organization 2 homolog n=1 Tax=Biomphalaria glabrata TaxID=6526 RepID=A0A9W2YFB2_BIOGL|nr:transport and Golgi organization 2 homolog [Biomphalaria glabrata]XP_055861443.1 transport and Golgi organization 2 homolog [Biomphalaria glabrata]XP_055861444.1 transport and Golgi organization 2 homolog [Biomphalaria glabrata]XP_055861445.1 transport and Golgi organization 2 homolog [Biomphalaria glabrata]